MSKTGVNVEIVSPNGKFYKDELKLRDEVLRKPLGLSLSDDGPDAESDIHIAAFVNGELSGCLVLTVLNGRDLKMRQVAVRESERGTGIGAAMVRFSENLAKKRGFSKIVLHARITSAGFYRKLGYEQEGKEFLEVGIRHICMFKEL